MCYFSKILSFIGDFEKIREKLLEFRKNVEGILQKF